MTAVLRHTAAVSHIDPANKQRDDDCQGVIPVWDPENLILTKWLHNKDWIPDWNDTLLNRHTAIHSRYLSR
ncbi:hypothetical protein [Wolbachia endosymbiont (group A) of Nomada goodeniana]|uniref:hypothetical protein n=1 Tax=unclassified Wolbachia TaxID=2640676 RepID=UPI0031333E07